MNFVDTRGSGTPRSVLLLFQRSEFFDQIIDRLKYVNRVRVDTVILVHVLVHAAMEPEFDLVKKRVTFFFELTECQSVRQTKNCQTKNSAG